MTYTEWHTVLARAISDVRLTHSSVRMLALLCFHANRRGDVKMSGAELSRACFMERRSVLRSTERLCYTGYITYKRGSPNVYRLALPPQPRSSTLPEEQ